MYNFPHIAIPKFFPVSEGALLQPWFSLDLLDQGLQLLREEKISGFHCLRNVVGALIDNKAPVLLEFAKNQKLHQGFSLQDSHCGLCRKKAGAQGCKHTAALAILSLSMAATKAKAMPIPLGFAESNWLKVGSFLFAWFGQGQTTTRRTEGKGCAHWQITFGDGLVQVAIPKPWASLGELLFSHNLKKLAQPKQHRGYASLISQMERFTMPEGESILAAAGRNSIGWQKDSSFGIWLARLMFIFHGNILPELQWQKETSRFVLRLGADQEIGSLTIILPRGKTWEVVRNLPSSSAGVTILPAARECSQVQFNADNLLEVTPCLRLADGRLFSRQDLATKRFSAAYYLEGEGFVPTVRLPAEGTFSDPAVPVTTMPLLGFVDNETTRDRPFTVAANDIPAFLKANRLPLLYPDNIVQPELLNLQIRELPERLFIDAFSEDDGWCYLSCRYGLGNTSITLQDIARAKAQQLTCLPGRQWLRIDGTPLSWLYDLAEDRFVDDGSGRIRLSYREMLALTAIIPEVELTIKKKSLRQHLASLLDVNCWTDDQGLGTIPGHLRPYQRNGVAWLNRLSRFGIGGLLADDMGLGKTHQGLALLQEAVKNGVKGQLMVVCPASVVLNWAEKIDRFYQGLDYTVYYGPQRDLQAAREHALIITTYGIIRQDLDLLRECSFDIILLDEIQHLKNRATATHQAAAALPARVKIGLTGTPVENSLQDLRSLFDICLPGLLGSERHFHHHYVQPITEAGNQEVRNRLSRLIHPFILRRSRGQVLTELPAIIEDDRSCELSDDQVALYREVIGERGKEMADLVEGMGAIPYMNILAIITRLKQICCHPCLVQGCDDPLEYASGKWDLFIELTSELLAANMKFVVFSQYTGMLQLIEEYLQKAGIPYASLKGDMTPARRQKMIDRFNTDPDCRVFCASLLAGGIGIDLTAAQAVIHYDRWWNPAREEQATARVHRMGQKNVVQVFRLITRGTLEEKIHQLITKKRELATSLIQEDEAGVIKQLDRGQLAELLRFSPV